MLAFEGGRLVCKQAAYLGARMVLQSRPYEELIPHFSAKHHVIAVDLPGHGVTPLGDVSPSFDSFAASICSFIVERQLHRPILIGHSMGGRPSVWWRLHRIPSCWPVS